MEYATNDLGIYFWIGTAMGVLLACGIVWLAAMAFVLFYDWLGGWDDE